MAFPLSLSCSKKAPPSACHTVWPGILSPEAAEKAEKNVARLRLRYLPTVLSLPISSAKISARLASRQLRKTSRFHATEKQVSHFGQCLLRLVKTGKPQTSERFPICPRLTSLRGGVGRNPKMVNACHPCPRLGCEVGGKSPLPGGQARTARIPYLSLQRPTRRSRIRGQTGKHLLTSRFVVMQNWASYNDVV